MFSKNSLSLIFLAVLLVRIIILMAERIWYMISLYNTTSAGRTVHCFYSQMLKLSIAW